MFKFLIFFLFLCTCLCRAEYKYQLAICAIFQDEAPYLKEWIEFHRLMGAEHFYLYNHRSRDNYQQVLKPYVASGLVELIDQPKVANRIIIFNRLQCKCYTECLAKAKGVSKWVAFIDIDEYLFPVTANSLLEVLKNYDEFGGVYANWRLFGTSNVRKIPKDQLLIETLVSCTESNCPINRYIKSIVKPECASHFPNPHHPVYLKGYVQVNTDKIPFEGAFLTPRIQTNKLCINHYWTRDEEFFYNTKILRQKKWGTKPDPENLLKMTSQEKDKTILRFAPALRKNMGMNQ